MMTTVKMHRALGIVLLSCTGLSGCADISFGPPQEGSVRGCPLQWDSHFPTSGNFTMNVPAECPFKLGGVSHLAYGANGSFPGGSTLQQYLLTMTDRLNRTTTVSYTSAWSNAGLNNLLVVTGDYYAGNGGFDAADSGFDKADNQILTGTGWSHGIGTLSYKFGSPSVYMNAPSGVGAGVSYILDATTDDPAWISPVTWAWHVDGVLMPTTESELQLQGSGSDQMITLTGTDYNGLSHTSYGHVSACPGTQITC